MSGRGNTEFGVPRKVNANGFNGRINYQLDGGNNVQSDRAGIRLMPISNTWVEEIQQVNNGFAPEFGNTVGTVFNTITKSGSNQTHGEAGYIFRRTPFSAAPALLAPGRPAPEVNVDSFFGNVGGKLVKDKLFWFGAFERVKRDLPNIVSVSATNLSALGLPASYADAIPFRQRVTFFMAKMDWQINGANLTFTYGLRYDVYVPPQAKETSPFFFSQSFRVDRNNFAPRLGVAWGLGKTVIRASGGIFFDPFQTDIYRRALLNNGTPQFFNLSVAPTNPIGPSFPDVFSGLPAGFTQTLQDITTVSPDFATLYSSNANLSVSRELGNNFGVTATYLFTRGNRLPVYRNINLGLTGNTLADGRPIFGGTRPISGFGNILAVESVGQSIYNGLNLTVTKRYSGGLEFFGTWTWSHAIDDAPEQNNIDSGNFLLSNPSNRRQDRGPSLSDRRHAFNANAVWNPTLAAEGTFLGYLVNNNRFSMAAVIQSGEVFNMGSNRILNGDAATPVAFQRPLFVGRNTLRAPGTWETNIRYSRIFKFGERWLPEFFAESTNIFNRTNVTAINSAAVVDTTGAIVTQPRQAWTGALDQRLIQFGIKLVF